MTTIFLFCIFFAVLAFFIYIAMKRRPRKLADLNVALDILLKRGFDCGVLIVDHAKSKNFVQFRKYIQKKGVYGIELGFPNVEWSKEFIPDVKMQADKYDLIISKPPWAEDKDAFLVIDFVRDTDKAYQFMRAIFLDVFGASEDDIYYARLDGVSVKDELIGG